MTLSRVEQNDPDLKMLDMSRDWDSNYWPNDSAELSRLGDTIGRNTHLQSLYIVSPRAEDIHMFAHNRTFFEGLKRNASIENLGLMQFDLSGEIRRGIMNEYVVNSNQLKTMMLSRCALGNGGIGVLTSAVTRCPNLETIHLPGCNIDDGMLEEFVSGIRGLNQLEKLDLGGNMFGLAGCEALATLLQDPNFSLHLLTLSANANIDDSCATIIANSLIGNSKLKVLALQSNRSITENGWDAFSTVLCNTSIINATYCSNHTLEMIGNSETLPTNLCSLLERNRNTTKEQVAVKKIIRYHPHLDMEPFLEWDLKVLPLAVSWFDKARGFSQNDDDEETNVDAMKLSAIYQFARAVPLMFVPSPKNASTKR